MAAINLENDLSKLTNEQKNQHRAAFLHFSQSIIGAPVDVSLINGSDLSGKFFASTPYASKSYNIALKDVKPADTIVC